MTQPARPPETAEGWYALHQIVRIDRRALRAVPGGDAKVEEMRRGFRRALEMLAKAPEGGWSAVVQLIGSRGDLMFMHFRPSLDEVHAAQASLAREPFFDYLAAEYSFLSVTEAGFYHLSAEAEKQGAAGGELGEAAYQQHVDRNMQAEIQSPHVQRRLYPEIPDGMPYVSFYPMSKRREAEQNWYALTLAERSRLMLNHGLVGRRYAGRVLQIITGAIGLSSWEWGVTLFTADPLEFKRLVTDMRFDEVSAKYAEFGEFFVGRLVGANAV